MEKTMKKTLMMSFVALMVSIAFVSAGMAQQKPGAPQPATAPQPADIQAKLEKFNGVIEKVDPATKEFVAQFHKETMTFSVGENTKFMEGSINLAFSDLKKGEWATVEYQKEGPKLVASMVKIWPM
jgi:hypothetical protein